MYKFIVGCLLLFLSCIYVSIKKDQADKYDELNTIQVDTIITILKISNDTIEFFDFNKIENIKQLTKRAQMGDLDAFKQLQEIKLQTAKLLANGTFLAYDGDFINLIIVYYLNGSSYCKSKFIPNIDGGWKRSWTNDSLLIRAEEYDSLLLIEDNRRLRNEQR